MTDADKAIIDKLLSDQAALQDRCDQLGLDWIGFTMATVIDALNKVETVPGKPSQSFADFGPGSGDLI